VRGKGKGATTSPLWGGELPGGRGGDKTSRGRLDATLTTKKKGSWGKKKGSGGRVGGQKKKKKRGGWGRMKGEGGGGKEGEYVVGCQPQGGVGVRAVRGVLVEHRGGGVEN